METTTRPDAAASAEERLLQEALGDELAGPLRVISREPLGAGSLTGIEELAPQPRHWYVDTSRRAVPEETGLVLGDPAAPEARIWLHPADPRLPALAPVLFPEPAAALMARLGVAIDRAPELLVYRAGKRAMLRMRAEGRETYLKVVRPSRAAAIVGLHESLRAGGVPVPVVTGWSPLGIVLTEAAAGEPLPARVQDADPAALLDAVERLRTAIASVGTDRRARASLADRHEWYRERLAQALERARAAGVASVAVDAVAAPLAALERAIDAAPAAAVMVPAEALRTVHGDLHIGQLFVEADDPSALSGVIDVDTAGLGDPVDDAAALLGHLAASIALADGDAARAAGLRRLLDAGVERWLAPDAPDAPRLAHRLAVHVIAHALGPLERGDARAAAATLEAGAEALRLPR
ncbi:phosphotransferase [Agrococcus sp. SL85]|uniref:phosphotransferase n=1 Tax=Agrococcus sp. SL85 TaxID=2995141 RepID=UPI00226C8B94|nr:phosphotransferase [Agrococcus sp. SL85]WAC66811.1 phosphotransferase [Agrococcus sp. SL85]